MARINTFSLLLVAVLVLAILIVTLVASGLITNVVLHVDHKNSSSISLEVTAPAASRELACDGCSGGGVGPH